MKRFVIGDIHGNYRGLMQCIERSGINYEKDRLIVLGDTCVYPDTEISCENGIKMIQDVKIGDYVLTHTGKYNKVINTYKNKVNKDILCFETYLHNKLKITENHPIFNGTDFIDSDKFKKKDFIFYPINKRQTIKYVDLYVFCKTFAYLDGDYLFSKKDQIKSSRIPQKFILNDRNLRIIGYFLGDGSRKFVKRRGTVGFSYENNKKKEILETDVIGFCEEHGIKYFMSEKGNMKKIHINSKILSSFFNIFYTKNKEKYIPKELFNCSCEQFLSILYGLIVTDGCLNESRIRFNNTSKILIDSIMLKCRECGILPTLSISRKSGECYIFNKKSEQKEYYEISFVNGTCKQIFKMFGIDKSNYGKNNNVVITKDYIKEKITNIQREKYNGYVYNIEVEDDNSYVANNICVHNCDGNPDTKLCIEELLKFKNIILLRSNHDDWTNDWFQNGTLANIHLNQGGKATLKSYNYKYHKEHHQFLKSAIPYYLTEDNKLFVHGGINIFKTLSEQHIEVLTWDRDMIETARQVHMCLNGIKPMRKDFFETYSKKLNKYNRIFCGHSTTEIYDSTEPLKFCNVWMLDTGAGWNGKLTIMNINTEEYWQSDAMLYPNQGR